MLKKAKICYVFMAVLMLFSLAVVSVMGPIDELWLPLAIYSLSIIISMVFIVTIKNNMDNRGKLSLLANATYVFISFVVMLFIILIGTLNSLTMISVNLVLLLVCVGYNMTLLFVREDSN